MTKTLTFLSGLIFLLVLAATVTGIFYRTPGSPIEYTTIRGEQVTYQGSGLYRYDPVTFAREGVIWDVVNLCMGLPLFALAIYLNGRDSLRGRLFLGGMLFYFSYVYLLAMTGYSFNPLFLVYVAIFALSAITFFLNLHGIDVDRLPSKFSPRFPHGLFIGFMFVMSAVLVFLWLGRILPIMVSGRFPADSAGMTTLVTQGFDLGMVVPLLLSAGVLLWRRTAWGYLLTSISVSYGLLMCISLPAWIVVPLIQDGKINSVEAVPFLLLSIFGLYLVGAFFRNVQEEKVH
jgi:hypothetical protein